MACKSQASHRAVVAGLCANTLTLGLTGSDPRVVRYRHDGAERLPCSPWASASIAPTARIKLPSSADEVPNYGIIAVGYFYSKPKSLTGNKFVTHCRERLFDAGHSYALSRRFALRSVPYLIGGKAQASILKARDRS